MKNIKRKLGVWAFKKLISYTLTIEELNKEVNKINLDNSKVNFKKFRDLDKPGHGLSITVRNF